MKRILTATVMVFVLGSTASWAQERKDLQVLKDVAKQVETYAWYTVFDSIDANVDNGVVTLSGAVTQPYKARDLEKRVAKVEGVTRVENKLRVLPVSQFDDELRFRASRAIYTNLNFFHMAPWVNPPIHIVVDRGHVTLTGVVDSPVDRALVRSLLVSLNAFSVKNELKTTAEIRDMLENAH